MIITIFQVAETVSPLPDFSSSSLNPCAIKIPENATLYDIQRGIRCQRCHNWRNWFNEEYRRPEPNDEGIDLTATTCSICDKENQLVDWCESSDPADPIPNGFSTSLETQLTTQMQLAPVSNKLLGWILPASLGQFLPGLFLDAPAQPLAPSVGTMQHGIAEPKILTMKRAAFCMDGYRCQVEDCKNTIQNGSNIQTSADTKFRCMACRAFWKKNGFDRSFSCQICHQEIGSYSSPCFVLNHQSVCKACCLYWNKHGEIRLVQICGNPECGVDVGVRAMKIRKLEGDEFCVACFDHWIEHAILPSARECANPECRELINTEVDKTRFIGVVREVFRSLDSELDKALVIEGEELCKECFDHWENYSGLLS
ncbi:hypothetical protein LX32DRAFT_651411 [Colletotrichum zoysiae]|uniref:Uncharacterized protein n=1 Tax=Colletotrichum zoysiae TaxID=1216348 RepID=A0AAD9HMQ7_9PEZI|nr:hypothetical protein LX32DRAFT_651411 [Colletotrichum zoysiae]